jgi:hypothetical protein
MPSRDTPIINSRRTTCKNEQPTEFGEFPKQQGLARYADSSADAAEEHD